MNLDNTYHFLQVLRNGVVMDVYWNIRSAKIVQIGPIHQFVNNDLEAKFHTLFYTTCMSPFRWPRSCQCVLITFFFLKLLHISSCSWTHFYCLLDDVITQGKHPTMGTHHAKFTNYTFDVEEFMRLSLLLGEQVRMRKKEKFMTSCDVTTCLQEEL